MIDFFSILSMLEIVFTAAHCKSYFIASAVLATAILSVRLSVTRQYCVKTTAHSTVQFALSESKMCLVFEKPKNIPEGRPLHPESLAQSDPHPPKSSEL